LDCHAKTKGMPGIPECNGGKGPECEPAFSDCAGRKGKPAIPDHDGKRFCRICDDFIPVEKFDRTTPRRFYCTFHIRTVFRKRGIVQLASINLRKRLRRDITRLFKKKVIKLSQSQIQGLLEEHKKTVEDYHKLYLLPRNPEEPVTPANVFLATKQQHQFLLALYKMTGQTDDYQRSIKAMSDENAAMSIENATSEPP
jgi:hypothetical protein